MHSRTYNLDKTNSPRISSIEVIDRLHIFSLLFLFSLLSPKESCNRRNHFRYLYPDIFFNVPVPTIPYEEVKWSVHYKVK